ncbi:putative Integral membrane protein hemolysin-III [Heracleum sosnowskyi]|uniref:Integral membrane protein hemolysin-III n=1 Tax=Heracleum sosnowskyi TaxID=360622 RepID=A0AAD8HWS8_9APIA|nr:putative Integral membrane protein hemolysin-III [Heracleum sosnowskyi]
MRPRKINEPRRAPSIQICMDSKLNQDPLTKESQSAYIKALNRHLRQKFQASVPMDSKLNHDQSPSSETDKQLSAPVTTKNAASLDLQNHNKTEIAKSVGTSPLPTESVHGIEANSLQELQKYQSLDSTVKDNRLDKSQTVFPKNDKQLSVPPTTKKTALRDLQNDNERVVPKTVGSSALLTETGSSVEAVKICGTKRAPPESLLSNRHHSSGGNAANGHLVYVRRKAETEPGKCSSDDSTSISADSQSKLNSHQNEHVKEHLQKKESDIPVPEALNFDKSSSECVSKAPAGPLPVPMSSNTVPSPVSDNLQVKSYQSFLDYQKRKKLQHWEERYYRLQNLLKQLDNSSQEGYVQMLRSLSSAELSRHAVELEKRSIQLSLTEGREWQRVMLLDVLGKDPKNYKATSTQQEQSKVKGQ